MASINQDPTDLANFDPFSVQPKGATPTASPQAPRSTTDPSDLANFDPFAFGKEAESKTGNVGSFVRGAIGGAAPALGAIRGGALGLELGAAGGPVGAIGGMLAGAYLGSEGMSSAQNWLLNKMPGFRDMLGQGEEQKRLDQQEHASASFMGGMFPYAITMSPMAALKTLPENATNWQRLLNNPYTSRLMSAGVVGGMQLGQEVASEDKINWNRVAIATAFGLAFNKNNRIGESISEFGAKPIRRTFGLPEPAFQRPPTVAEVNESDAGIGINEAVSRGEEARPKGAADDAIVQSGTEQSILNPRREDVENRARRSNPELFDEYSALLTRQTVFKSWIDEANEPRPYQFSELAEQREALEKELADHVAANKGYDRGKIARQLKAQIRSVQAEHDALTERAVAFKGGTAQETPDIAQARQHLMATDEALRDIQPKIRDAYNDAAKYVGAPIVAPAPPEVAAPPTPTAETPAGSPAAVPTAEAAAPQAARPFDEQKAFIAKHASDQLIKAGEPPERAELIGQLIAQHYASRASRFGGALGSALDLYKAEGERFVGGRYSVKAPPTAPNEPPSALPTTKEEFRAFIASGGEIKAAPRGGVAPAPLEHPPAAEAPPATPPAAGTVASVPFMITTAMKSDLAARGHTPEQIRNMRPQEAQEALKEDPLPPIIEMKKRAPRGPQAKDPDKYSIFEFLAKGGGIEDTPDTRALFSGKNPFVPGFGPLLRKSGRSIDRALESATEGGYLSREGEGQPKLVPEDLRKLLDTEGRGQKQYKLGQAPPEKKVDLEEHRHRINQAIDDEATRQGLKPDGIPSDVRDRMVELMQRGDVHDPAVALEQGLMELENRGYETGETESKSEHIPGWDVAIPDESRAAPGPGEGVTPRGGQAPLAEVGEHARPSGGDHREPAEANPLAHLTQDDLDQFFQATRGQKLGSIRLTDDIRAIITRLPDANASTIVHELGHSWLEQLMRDSQHAAAPDGLRNDAATVIRWLGIDSAESLRETTKSGNITAKARNAHEKFATGFEQYLREGKAPSAELANVFARFKAWLLDLYKTIKGLGKEINPDIRAVFDRMLTEEPQETVIAPHQERGPTLQDIHAGDAKSIEPAEGEQARDRVAAERDRYAEEQPENIKAGVEAKAREAGIETRPEQGAKPAGEGGEGPSGRGEVVGGGGAPESQPAGGGVREEHGPVVEGGANAGTEGAAVPGAGQRAGEPAGASAAEREHPIAPTPARDSIPPRESKAVDLAGNIRIENVTNIEEAAQAMRDSAERNNDYMAIRGQPITDHQLWEMAGEFGMNPAEVDMNALKSHLEGLFGGLKDAAPKMAAGRKMVQDTAKEVATLSRAAMESKTPEDIYAATQAITRLDIMMKALSGGTASWGRTGRALRDITGQEGKDAKAIQKLLIENTGRTLFQMSDLIKKIAQYDRTDQVNKFVRDSAFHPWRMITEIWINGLISGLQTHLTYGVGNTITSLEKVGPDTAAAAGIGALRKMMGRKGDTVSISEVGAGLKAMWQGIPSAALSAAESVETGTTTLLHRGEQTRFIQPLSPADALSTAGVLNEAAKWSDVGEKLYGIAAGVREGVVAGAALQAAGGVEGLRPAGLLPSRGATPDILLASGVRIPTGAIATAPSRMVAAIHSFFRPLNYVAHISQLAVREAHNNPIEGVPSETQVANFKTNPPQWAIDEAITVSNKQTLMDQGGDWTRKLSTLINHEFLGKMDTETGKRIPGTGVPILKFIDPFIHISSNIINWGIVEHTPVGILSPSIRADLMGKNGTIAADLAAGKMLAGTALSILFGTLAAEGYVTGSGPSNPDDAALWRQVYQPHSVRIGDTWYAMNRLGPMGMLLSTAADLYDVAHVAEEGDFAKAASALMHATAQNILDESFMRGPSDLIKAISQPDRYGAPYVRNFVSSFVPFSTAMRQMARAVDPYSRQARTMADAVRGGIPGLSMDLMPRRDNWGEPLPSREGLGGDLTAIWQQRVNSDPTNQALVDLGIHVGIPGRTIRNVKLNDEQYDDYSRLAGRLAKLRMDAMVRSPSFQSMPPGVRQDYVNEQLKQSRNVAQGMMFMKYPSILVDAHTAKMAKQMGTAP